MGQDQVHSGHRARMRERFMANGFEGFADHEVLEVLLYNVITRGNTNPLGHKLIERFGSFARVCDASIEELMSVEGIGESCAIQIKMIPELLRYYMLSHEKHTSRPPLNDGALVAEYLRPYFLSQTKEILYFLTLDNSSRPLECVKISEGVINATDVDLRKITEVAINSRACFAILAHNHPYGHAFPSTEDLRVTELIAKHLQTIGIQLVDHMLFTETEAVSIIKRK